MAALHSNVLLTDTTQKPIASVARILLCLDRSLSLPLRTYGREAN